LNEKDHNETALEIERYHLGLMTPDEEVAFEHRVRKSSELSGALREQGDALTAMYEDLAKGMPAKRKELKEQFLEKANGNSVESYPSDEFVLKATDSEWIRTSIPGIEFRMLYTDDDGRTMLLARFAPGAEFPAHNRLDTEECYVISGDFWADGQKLGAGDFIAGKKGFEPIPIYSQGGCELLLKLRIPNEIMPQN
jgi:anti-sigma factor ChrR (cupin superfamily)